MEYLKHTLGVLTVLEKDPSHFDCEIDIIPAWDVVDGPLKLTPEVEASTTSIQKLKPSKVLVPGYRIQRFLWFPRLIGTRNTNICSSIKFDAALF